jgi:hypothetical protein
MRIPDRTTARPILRHWYYNTPYKQRKKSLYAEKDAVATLGSSCLGPDITYTVVTRAPMARDSSRIRPYYSYGERPMVSVPSNCMQVQRQNGCQQFVPMMSEATRCTLHKTLIHYSAVQNAHYENYKKLQLPVILTDYEYFFAQHMH